MDYLVLVMELFGALFLIFAIGELIGHIFKLDEYLRYDPKDRSN
jgi:hypothetical protein